VLGVAGAFLVLLVLSVLLQVLDQTGRLPLPRVGALGLGGAFMAVLGVLFFVFVEVVVWRGLLKSGSRGAKILAVLMHLAVGLGFVVSFRLPLGLIYRLFQMEGLYDLSQPFPVALMGNRGRVVEGIRLGATYAGLVVLAYLIARVAVEAVLLRWRRLYAIAWQTVVEAYRRMWAPWVVLALFIVILAFTNWFLAGQRTAELAQLYVSTLSVVISLLLTLMILILAPISIPNDIRQQTIYTVVSKPVRRLEMIWGRLLGYSALVTVVLVIFGLISLVYIDRVVRREIPATRERARAALEAGRIAEARQLDEAANQLKARLSSRVPEYGSLMFVDSRGNERVTGIDVGMEQTRRSHIEGATPSKATWRFGVYPDPMNPAAQVDTRLDVDSLPVPGSVEAVQNQLVNLQGERAAVNQKLSAPDLKTAEMREQKEALQGLDEQIKELESELRETQREELELRRKAREQQIAGNKEEAEALRGQIEAFHSPPIPLEMTFNVYRTTKGALGEAVRASVVVTNPFGDVTPARDLFPIHEYYTIRRSFPSRMLVGSRGWLNIDVQCVTPNQFLGMAEDDLYVLADQGRFEWNFLRGLVGLWLQALVLIAVGLFAGTFLSWPVAFLLTVAFYLAGQVAVGFLQEFAAGQILGGGPFESLIRLVGHNNQMTELDPTLGVVVAKSFDQLVMPFMSRLPYLIPNLSALDVSNRVAAGFAVPNSVLFMQVLLGLGYALPFTIAAYYILKNREVAA
jgi:ABC-type transport system involved in multi-copper enzyme maturation permease subunit